MVSSLDVHRWLRKEKLNSMLDAAAEQRDPDSFDPTQNLRDYAAIDLPGTCPFPFLHSTNINGINFSSLHL